MAKTLKTVLIVVAAILWLLSIAAFVWLIREAANPGPKPLPRNDGGSGWGWLVPILVIVFWGIIILAAVVIGRSSGRKTWSVPELPGSAA